MFLIELEFFDALLKVTRMTHFISDRLHLELKLLQRQLNDYCVLVWAKVKNNQFFKEI